MQTQRLRIFAGPNGSGKTSIIRSLKDKINFGCYINADDIEKELLTAGYYCADNIPISNDSFFEYINHNSISTIKCPHITLSEYINIDNNIIYNTSTTGINSYIAADIAAYLRHICILQQRSFTFETVFSHPSKIDFIKSAKSHGFRVYLYFITTETPEINIRRVRIRVAQSGHDVPENIIIDRYNKTMKLLPQIIKNSDRAYLFDNSGTSSVYIAEITNGSDVALQCDQEQVPNWFSQYIESVLGR
jgi:predicted ABC-type ATPase